MAGKRTPRKKDTCQFCGAGLEGRSPKTKFCSPSCRAKFWRRGFIVSEHYEQVAKHLNALADLMGNPVMGAEATETLRLIKVGIEQTLNDGYQPTLPGVES